MLRHIGRSLTELFGHTGIVPAPGGMQQSEALLTVEHGYQLGHDLVHVPCAEGAPHGDHELFPGRDAKLRLGLLLRLAAEFAAHRCAGDLDSVRVLIVPAAVLKADKHTVNVLCQHLRREPRHGVALMHEGRDMQLVRRRQHRVADISACAYDRVGLKLAYQLLRLMQRYRDVLYRVKVMRKTAQTVLTADVRDLQPLYAVALARHKLHLHLALRADKQHFRIGQQLAQPSRDRERGVNVSGSPAAGKDKFHIRSSFQPMVSMFPIYPSTHSGLSQAHRAV